MSATLLDIGRMYRRRAAAGQRPYDGRFARRYLLEGPGLALAVAAALVALVALAVGGEVCPAYAGSRILRCPACAGAKFAADVAKTNACATCSGSGAVTRPVWHTIRGGAGRRNTSVQSGSVRLACGSCRGTGFNVDVRRAYCGTCLGQGVCRCVRCGGKGSVR